MDSYPPDRDPRDTELASNETGYLVEFDEPDTRTIRLRILRELQEIRFRASVVVVFLFAVVVILVIGLAGGFD